MRKLLTIAVLALTQSGDTMLNVALVWTALRVSSSAVTLSIVLTVMTIAPFGLQWLLPWTKQWIASRPAAAFRAARLSGIVIGLVGAVLPDPLSMGTLYALAGAFAVVVFLAQQSLETMMSTFVLAGTIDSREGSRLLQTGTQLGAFVGGAFGGLLFERAGIHVIFLVLCATVLVGALAPMLLAQAAAASSRLREAGNAAPSPAPAFAGSPAQRLTVLWLALIAIGVLTVQVGAFNLFVPILCEKAKHWQASDYGIVTASAGLGALIATVRLLPERFHTALSLAAVAGIAVADVGLWLTDHVLLAALLAALGGFSVNTLRIAQRATIYEAVTSPAEGAEWAGRTTVMSQATRATVPLALAGVLAWYGLGASGPAFAATGFALAALLLVFLVQQGRLRLAVAGGASADFLAPRPQPLSPPSS